MPVAMPVTAGDKHVFIEMRITALQIAQKLSSLAIPCDTQNERDMSIVVQKIPYDPCKIAVAVGVAVHERSEICQVVS